MAIIGLCGLPGAGKTEVRKMLVRDFGFEDICSKSTIYQLAEVATGIPAHKFADPFYKDDTFEGFSLRRIAAHMGYGIEELFGETYLINKAMENHQVKERPNKNFVVDSLRMSQPSLIANEKHTDFYVVEIINPKSKKINEVEHFDRYFLPETAYWQILNNATHTELHERIKNLLNELNIDYPVPR